MIHLVLKNSQKTHFWRFFGIFSKWHNKRPHPCKFIQKPAVGGKILQRLCEYFNCQYSDIIENTPEK